MDLTKSNRRFRFAVASTFAAFPGIHASNSGSVRSTEDKPSPYGPHLRKFSQAL